MIAKFTGSGRFHYFMSQVAGWGAVVLMFGIPTGIALVNLGVLLVILGWVFSGHNRTKWDLIKNNPITLPSVLLMTLVLVGCLYTEAPAAYQWKHLYVYSKLPLMLILLAVLHGSLWQRRAFAAFSLGALVTLFSTYFSVWFDVPWSEAQINGSDTVHNVFNDDIAQALMMAVFVIMCVSYSLETNVKYIRLLWWLIASLSVFSVTHLLGSRTGQFVMAPMFLVMAFFSISVARRWLVTAVVIILTGMVFFSSPLLRANVDLALLEIGRYMSGDTALTSIGARLEMWRVSYGIFLDSPFLGHGTGSYRALSEKIFSDPEICAVSCIHPHNQFLFFGVEYGLLGMAAYIFFLWRPFAYGIACVGRERLMLVCLVTVMFVDSFINGPLWVTTERHLFTSVLPLFMAGWRPAGQSGDNDGDGVPQEADSA